MIDLINSFNVLGTQITRILGDVTGNGHYYHCALKNDSNEEFKPLPLSHFGDLSKATNDLINAASSQNHGRIAEARINIKNPLKLNHINQYDFTSWRKALEEIKTEEKLPVSLLNYIFVHPFEKKNTKDLVNELERDGIFNIKNLPDIGAYQINHISNQNYCPDKNTAKCVVIKRLIKTLESLGYDGVKYREKYDKAEKNNYVIFDPETQITSLDFKTKPLENETVSLFAETSQDLGSGPIN